jgi:hypothetical protein
MLLLKPKCQFVTKLQTWCSARYLNNLYSKVTRSWHVCGHLAVKLSRVLYIDTFLEKDFHSVFDSGGRNSPNELSLADQK